ncbi:biotin--[acetyl-CoA-carboxylase] ligase [Thermodesulfobacteriota bacterium]
MKAKILGVLRAAEKPVSGEALGRELGVSRVTVWKHVTSLREMGYPIRASSVGYRLEGYGDLLHSWEFPGREDRIHYLEETTSTMDVARNMAREGCSHGTVVVAERQTRGRGRLKRQWYSEDGGLYFTMVLRPPLPVNKGHLALFCASVALAETIRNLCGVHAEVKWPNDILVGHRKLSGMLSEMLTEAERILYLNLGIGVNVNNNPSAQESRAIALKDILEEEFPRSRLLASFLDAFDERMSRLHEQDVISEWKRYSGTLDRPVRIVTLEKTLEGKAVDVDRDGALILELEGGSLERVLHGDCFLTETASSESNL